MEPNWGIVEFMLGNGMEDLKDHISPETWKTLEEDMSSFKYGEVYDLLAYIDKNKKRNSTYIDEAGRMLGFLPRDNPEDPSAPAILYARKLTSPRKAEFPLDWSTKRIQQEVESIRHDSTLDAMVLWNNYRIKDGVRDGVSIRVIYEKSLGQTDYWGEYPTNTPLTEQKNRVGEFRIWLETLMTESLDKVRGGMPALDYRICAELIQHGQYGAAFTQLLHAFEMCGLLLSELESARQAIIRYELY